MPDEILIAGTIAERHLADARLFHAPEANQPPPAPVVWRVLGMSNRVLSNPGAQRRRQGLRDLRCPLLEKSRRHALILVRIRRQRRLVSSHLAKAISEPIFEPGWRPELRPVTRCRGRVCWPWRWVSFRLSRDSRLEGPERGFRRARPAFVRPDSWRGDRDFRGRIPASQGRVTSRTRREVHKDEPLRGKVRRVMMRGGGDP